VLLQRRLLSMGAGLIAMDGWMWSCEQTVYPLSRTEALWVLGTVVSDLL
jgi:hypothetical protein